MGHKESQWEKVLQKQKTGCLGLLRVLRGMNKKLNKG